jgi:GWxTD domain-containing protein
MRPKPVWWPWSLLLIVLAPTCSAADARASRAEALFHDADRRLAEGGPAQRRFAREELEQATRLAPADDRIALALGRLLLEAGMLQRARAVAHNLIARSPNSGEAHSLLGETERQQWLMDPDAATLDQAIASLTRALRLGARDLRRGELLVPLLIEAGEDSAALAVAEWTARTAAGDPHAAILVACALQAAGGLEVAAEWYERALARLPERERARYDDLRPLLPFPLREAWEDLPDEARRARAAAFWRRSDPDPVSALNEARLEFQARVTRALLLYGVDDFGDMDERGQVTVRFGSPAQRERQPIRQRGPTEIGNVLAWTYPALGMRIWLGASNPQGHYRARHGSAVKAFAESLATHPELVGALGGWATFRTLPAGMQHLDARCLLAHFPSAAGEHVLAQLESMAAAGTSLTTDWVVLDTGSVVVARGHGGLGPSACGDFELRAASFDATLAPGRYRVAARVDDGGRRRAVLQQDVLVQPRAPGLALSDLVVVCGRPEAGMIGPDAVRLEPSTGLQPQSGEQLVTYGEIHGLQADGAGGRRFEYSYSVEPEKRDPRSFLARFIAPRPVPPGVQMTRREEEAVGDVRRQFFRIPVGTLPTGRYRVELRVRDLVSGEEASRLAVFDRR